MNRHLSVLKFVLLISSLVSALSCGSQKPGEKAINAVPNNGNANAASPPINRVSKAKQHDPKLVCAWLPDFTPAEYKLYTTKTYTCKSEHEETGGGKRLVWTYEPFGTSTNIDSVELTLSTIKNTPEATQKAEGRFVKLAETLWQKSFDKPLPNEIKNELLANKGKLVTSSKDWSFEKNSSIPINTIVQHTGDARLGIYILKLRFYLPE